MSQTDFPSLTMMPPWPGSGITSPERALSESSRLCVDCGLCCNGALFSWAPLTDADTTDFADTAIRPYRDSNQAEDEDPIRMVLPCACHVNGRCSIFPKRPRVCSSYRCDLLKATMNGSVDYEQARETTARIKAQFEWLRSAAARLGYLSPSRSGLHSVLRAFCDSVHSRMSFAPPYPDEAQFARRAFEYLQNVDRHLERTKQLARFAAIVSELDRPKPGFDVPDVEICRLRFGRGQTLELRGCRELAAVLRKTIKGWDLTEIECGDEGRRTVMRVWTSNGHYYWDMPFPGPHYDEEEPLTETIDLLHEVHYYLDDVHALDSPSHFFLHSAAIEIRGRVILLLGTHMTGKTSLSMALAAQGHKLLADDRIAIDAETGRAVAVGSVPLLRKPFPDDVGFWPAKTLVRRYRGPEDDDFAYVDLPEELFAPRGYVGQVAAIVTLERSDRPIATTLAPIAKSEAIAALAKRHYCKALRASEAFEGMLKLADGAATYSLKYATTKTAVRAIEGILAEDVATSEERLLTMQDA